MSRPSTDADAAPNDDVDDAGDDDGGLVQEEIGLLVETAACDQLSLDHVANNGSTPQHYDAVATVETDHELLEAGTRLDAKACAVTISDGSTSRRGRWWFSKTNHERLLEDGGAYGLGVYDAETYDVLELVVLRASDVDDLLADRWANSGTHHASERSAQLPWTAAIDGVSN